MSEVSKPHSEPSEKALWEYLDLEAYDVVPGPQYRSLLEQYQAALKLIDNLATRKDGDGQLCWCITGVRSGLFLQGDHSKYCENSRAMLASNPANVPYGTAPQGIAHVTGDSMDSRPLTEDEWLLLKPNPATESAVLREPVQPTPPESTGADSVPAKKPPIRRTSEEEMREWNAHIEQTWLTDASDPAIVQDAAGENPDAAGGNSGRSAPSPASEPEATDA